MTIKVRNYITYLYQKFSKIVLNGLVRLHNPLKHPVTCRTGLAQPIVSHITRDECQSTLTITILCKHLHRMQLKLTINKQYTNMTIHIKIQIKQIINK